MLKRTLIALLAVATLFVAADAKPSVKKKQPKNPKCAADIGACAAEGCSADNHHDPNLNRLKNTTSAGGPATDRSMTWMKTRANPKHLVEKGSRNELKDLGEGEQVRVVGYLLAAKLEPGGESCNCYLRTKEETDNHLVLVTKNTVDKFPLPAHASKSTLTAVFHKREAESVTAEFTPRVRLEHPNFTAAKVQSILNKTPQGAILVRLTGQLMFDSEHFFRHKLKRVNNWEIHPVTRVEYCPLGKTCSASGDDNWVDLDQ
jgi:hypothetical protein